MPVTEKQGQDIKDMPRPEATTITTMISSGVVPGLSLHKQ